MGGSRSRDMGRDTNMVSSCLIRMSFTPPSSRNLWVGEEGTEQPSSECTQGRVCYRAVIPSSWGDASSAAPASPTVGERPPSCRTPQQPCIYVATTVSHTADGAPSLCSSQPLRCRVNLDSCWGTKMPASCRNLCAAEVCGQSAFDHHVLLMQAHNAAQRPKSNPGTCDCSHGAPQ